MHSLVFDFDSTLVRDEGLDELFARSLEGAADRGRRLAEFRALTDRGMDGEMSADAALIRRLERLEADRALVEEVAEGLAARLTPSVAGNLEFFRGAAPVIRIVSGGFRELIGPTAERLGIPASHVAAHRFRFDAGGRVAGLDPATPMARGGKPEALRSLAIPAGEIWVVGDGVTDLELRTLGLVSRFVAFTENRRRGPVVAGADHEVGSIDELLTLLKEVT